MPVQDITTGMLLWAAFDESGGATPIDATGNCTLGRFGTTAFVAGKINNGLQVQGPATVGNVTVTAATSSLDTPQFTTTCWFKPNVWDVNAFTSIISKQNATSPFQGIDIRCTGDGTGKLVATMASGSGPTTPRSVTNTTVVTAGSFWHVAATYDASLFKLYLTPAGGATVLVTDGPTAGGAVASSSNYVIGTNPIDATARNFNGIIDEVRQYNRALTAAQIAALIAYPTVGGKAAAYLLNLY